MPQKEVDLDAVRDECFRFPDNFQSVLMATVSQCGIPEASYAAYVQLEDDYYVYVSELSRHTKNLAESDKVSLLFIEEEASAQHLFARQRMTLQCDVSPVARSSQRFEQIMDLFEQKFGSFISMLKKLQDFHLFRISPQKGAFVRGFAQAFELDGKGMSNIRHMNGRGHKAQNDETSQKMDDYA